MILRRFLNADVAIALVMLVLGCYWAIAAVPYGLWRGSTPGTGFLPFWYGILIVLLAVAILFQRLRNADDSQSAIESPVKPLLILLIVAAAIVGLEVVGFIPAILATLLLLFIVVERLPLVASAVIAVVTTAVLYLMFEKWLGVPLPQGLLGA